MSVNRCPFFFLSTHSALSAIGPTKSSLNGRVGNGLDAIDSTIAVVTPENIAFEYQLAGPFRRLPAFVLDLLIQYVVLAVVAVVALIAAGFLALASLGSFAIAGLMVFQFVLFFFYGAFFEAYFNGRTPGKGLCGIRVIDVEGRPINGTRALLRNLIRVADGMPLIPILLEDMPPLYIVPTGVFGLLAMAMTRRMQRLGDLAAGTMVIVDERGANLPVAQVDDARVPALASYIPGDYRVTRSMSKTLASYVERRATLSPARRREIAKHLVVDLIERFEFRPDIDPDLLMYALYYQTFLADRDAGPPDLGSLAGFSPLAKDMHRPIARPAIDEDSAAGENAIFQAEIVHTRPTPGVAAAGPNSGEGVNP